MFPPPDRAADEIAKLSARVEKQFKVREVLYRPPEGVAFAVDAPAAEVEARFDALRRDLVKDSYIPVITREGHGLFITVGKIPSGRTVPVWVNLVLFFATIATTVVAGGSTWALYTNDVQGAVTLESLAAAAVRPHNLALGALTFALPLMLILGLHELGHYYVSRRYGLKASLPFFIPMPPILVPLGTMGAFISMREPIPSKKALIDIGAAGPIVGFAVAIPVVIAGAWLTATVAQPIGDSDEGGLGIGSSLLYTALTAGFGIPDDVQLHPTAFAGWVGLLVTALNLMPASMFDGGHVARALFGDRARYFSWASFLVLVFLGFSFFSWWIYAFLILLFGFRHPPPLDDLTPLDFKRKLVGLAAIAILVTGFVPVPMVLVEPNVTAKLTLRNSTSWEPELHWNETAAVGFNVTNTGDSTARLNVSLEPMPLWPWSLVGFRDVDGLVKSTVSHRLRPNESVPLTLSLKALWDPNSTAKKAFNATIVVKWERADGEMPVVSSQEVGFKVIGLRDAGGGAPGTLGQPARPTSPVTSLLTPVPSRRCAA